MVLSAVIDIENIVFDACAKAVLAEYPDCFTTSENVMAPASFPAVSIVETSNTTDRTRNDSSLEENASIVTYTVRVYSNLRHGAKRQAKEIAQIIDGVLQPLNFTRGYSARNDGGAGTPYSIVSNYTASVSKDGIISRR